MPAFYFLMILSQSWKKGEYGKRQKKKYAPDRPLSQFKWISYTLFYLVQHDSGSYEVNAFKRSF